MTDTLRNKLIQKGWVTEFNADTLTRLIEEHYAALADEPAVPEGREPVSVVEEPCDEELLKLARAELNNSPNWEEPEYDASNPFPYEAPGIAWLNFARAVLARFGHHSPEATKMVSDAYQMGRRDASADSQQAAEAAEDEVAELALKELERTVVLLMPVTGHKKIKRFDTIRAALKRLQELENNADLSPAPAPAEGEVAELMAWLRMQGEAQKPGPNSLLCDKTKKELHANGTKLVCAAELLQRLISPQPVPVSERPWEREGWCDEEGRCWMGRPLPDAPDRWDWSSAVTGDNETHCLPHDTQLLPTMIRSLPLPWE